MIQAEKSAGINKSPQDLNLEEQKGLIFFWKWLQTKFQALKIISVEPTNGHTSEN